MSKFKELIKYFGIFSALIKRELLLTRRGYKESVINICMILFTNLVVYSYFVPQFRSDGNFGPFILAGSVATFGFFSVVNKTTSLMEDLEGDRRISYIVTMPLPTWMAIGHIGFAWAIESALYALILFPLGKVILPFDFHPSEISFWRLIIIYTLFNLFYGFFGLWLAGKIRHMGQVANIWLRVINPLFMFGAFFYTWGSINKLSSVIGTISLINPLVYANEGVRAAMFGNDGYLPFWVSCLCLIGFVLFCAVDGIRLMRKRLDCV